MSDENMSFTQNNGKERMTPPTIDFVLLEKENISQAKRDFSAVGVALALLALVRLAAQTVMVGVIYLFFPATIDAWWMNWLLSIVPLYVFALPVFMLALHKVRTAPHADTYLVKGRLGEEDTVLSKPRFRVKELLLFAVASMGVMYIGSYIGETVMSILSVIMGYDYSSALGTMVDATPQWFTLIMTCIIAPFGEELIFRKLLIDKTRRYGDALAIVISALSFGLFHMNFYQFFYAVLIGFIAAYAYTLTGKLRWSIAIHSFVNFIGSIVIPAMASHVDFEVLNSGDLNAIVESVTAAPVGYLLYAFALLLTYAAGIAAVVIIILHFRKLALSKSRVRLVTAKLSSLVINNGGMILAIIVMGLMFALNLLPA
ncbi:MAG: CPBP family intramembrane metalloprotease [Ruminococcaceae bacterium]|nr:CPBP family intramembrane metalloprotease [Oscillospiraceae bacterium]